MSSTMSTPRILPAHLHAFAPNTSSNNTVRMLGTISHVNGDQATLVCGTDSVTVLLNRDSHVSVGSMYEIVGKVVNIDGGHIFAVRVLSSTEWPRNEQGQLPDLKLFEAVVDATHRHKTLFYGADGGMEGGY